MSQFQVESTSLSNSVSNSVPQTAPRPNAYTVHKNNYELIREHFDTFIKKKETEHARRALRKLVSMRPVYEDIRVLARLEFESGAYTSCLEAIEWALEKRGAELKGLSELYRLQGASLIHLGQLDQAEDSLFKALEYPGEPDGVLVNLGTLDIQRKSWESATTSFREALKCNSKNDKAWVGLALCHRFRGDHTLALGNLELALDHAPLNETALGLLLAWYGETESFIVQKRLCDYLVSGGENENLWLAFVDVTARIGERQIARFELERLRLTHPEFLPAYQMRV